MNWLKKLLENLLGPSHQALGKTGLQIPFQPPQVNELSRHFIPRPEVEKDLKRLLLGNGQQADSLHLVAIHGMGGSGKSVTAAAIARDPDVVARFRDGILWTTLGEQPNLADILAWLDPGFERAPVPVLRCSRQVCAISQACYEDKHVLLVVDDAWVGDQVEKLITGGPGCAVLITTREALVAKTARVPDETIYELPVMQPEESLALLARGVHQGLSAEDRSTAMEVAEALGHLPLALDLAAAQVNDKDAGVSWSELRDELQQEIVRLDRLEDVEVRELPLEARKKHLSLLASLNLSLNRLSAERREQFAWLGVLADDALIGAQLATTLWSTSPRKARDALRYFRKKALLTSAGKFADGTPVFRLHDVLHDLARRVLTAPRSPERPGETAGPRLDPAGGPWHLAGSLPGTDRWTGNGRTLPDDGYAYTHLAWHMREAERIPGVVWTDLAIACTTHRSISLLRDAKTTSRYRANVRCLMPPSPRREPSRPAVAWKA